MPISFSGFPIVYKPTLLDTGYAAGDVLFDPVKIDNFNLIGARPSQLWQLGIFWDMASAPEITLYFFNADPESFGAAGEQPAPTFDDRLKLVAEYDIDSTVNQGYDTLLGDNGAENSYALVIGNAIGVFNSSDKTGYVSAVVKTAVTAGLSDKLGLTFIVKKSL